MLSSNTSVVRYAISAAVTAYDIGFPFWDFSEIVVTAINSATGESVILKKDVDYTITVSEAITDPVYQNGTVNMVSDAYKNYTALVISRELPLTQDTDYKNSESLNADTLEMSFDRATAQIQQLKEEIGHSIKLPITENPGDYKIPEASQRGSKVLGFGSDGNTIVMYKNPDDAVQQIEDVVDQIGSMKNDVEKFKDDAQEAAVDAVKAAESIESAKDYMDAAKMAGFEAVLGDGSSTEFTVKHNLQTRKLFTQIWDNTDAGIPVWYISIIDDNTLKVSFESAPPAESLTLYISAIYSRELTNVKISWGNVIDVAIRPDQVSDEFFMTKEEMLEFLNDSDKAI